MGAGLELFGLHKDGHEFPVEISLSPLDTGDGTLVSSAIRDITERKKSEEALRESEQHLRDVIETIPAAAWIGRPDGTIDFVNQRWQEYTGLSLRDMFHSGWRTVLHPDNVASHSEKWRESIATGTPFENEARLRRASDDEHRWFLHRGVPLRNQQGVIVKWYATGIDIEDRKRAEEALPHSFLPQTLRRLFDQIGNSFRLRDINRVTSLRFDGMCSGALRHWTNHSLTSNASAQRICWQAEPIRSANQQSFLPA